MLLFEYNLFTKKNFIKNKKTNSKKKKSKLNKSILNKKTTKVINIYTLFKIGFEPTTSEFSAQRSTPELLKQSY